MGVVRIESIGPHQELHIKRVTGMGATTATPGMGNAFSCPWTVTSVGPIHPVTASGLVHLQIEQQNATQLFLPKIYSPLCCLVGSASHPRDGNRPIPHPATPRDFAFLATDLHAIDLFHWSCTGKKRVEFLQRIFKLIF